MFCVLKPVDDSNHLTNEKLIEMLQTLPKDALVWHEGCDCWGQANRVEYFKDENIILIGRP